MFGHHSQLKKYETKTIQISDVKIPKVDIIRYLGAWLDNNLSFKHHVMKKCQVAMWNFLRIRSIRKYLTKEACETLVIGVVMSHLDYSNSLLIGVPKCTIKPMQRIQNMCAKLILERSKYDSSICALKELHWLPIYKRIEFKILCLVHKSLIGEAPDYLSEMFKPIRRTSTVITRSAEENLLEIPFTERATFACRSIGVQGPKLWNKLPTNIREVKNHDNFKKVLKTHFFHKELTLLTVLHFLCVNVS